MNVETRLRISIKTQLSLACKRINAEFMPSNGFEYLASITAHGDDLHHFVLDGASSEDGLRKKEIYYLHCGASDCRMESLEGSTPMPSELEEILRSCLKDGRDNVDASISDENMSDILQEMEAILDRSINEKDHLNNLYYCKRSNNGEWATWRLFLPTSVNYNRFPHPVYGITVDTDGEVNVLSTYTCQLSEPVMSIPDNLKRKLISAMHGKYNESII